MRITLLASAILCVLGVPLAHAEADSNFETGAIEPVAQQCTAEKQVMDDLKHAMEEEVGNLQRDSEGLGQADDLSIKFDVEWDTVDVRFHVPEYQGMKRQDVSLDLPQVSMRRSNYSFDVPDLKWDTTVVGYYPRVHHLRVRMEPIKTKVPKWYHKTVRASWDIPDISWDRTGFSLDLPQFGRQEVTWKFDVPRLRLDEVHIDGKPIYDRELKERSKELEARGHALATKYEHAMKTAADNYVGCFASDMKAARSRGVAQFDAGLATLRAAQSAAIASGAPDAMRNDKGEDVSFVAMIQDMEKKRDAFIDAIDEQLHRIDKSNGAQAAPSELVVTTE